MAVGEGWTRDVAVVDKRDEKFRRSQSLFCFLVSEKHIRDQGLLASWNRRPTRGDVISKPAGVPNTLGRR